MWCGGLFVVFRGLRYFPSKVIMFGRLAGLEEVNRKLSNEVEELGERVCRVEKACEAIIKNFDISDAQNREEIDIVLRGFLKSSESVNAVSKDSVCSSSISSVAVENHALPTENLVGPADIFPISEARGVANIQPSPSSSSTLFSIAKDPCCNKAANVVTSTSFLSEECGAMDTESSASSSSTHSDDGASCSSVATNTSTSTHVLSGMENHCDIWDIIVPIVIASLNQRKESLTVCCKKLKRLESNSGNTDAAVFSYLDELKLTSKSSLRDLRNKIEYLFKKVAQGSDKGNCEMVLRSIETADKSRAPSPLKRAWGHPPEPLSDCCATPSPPKRARGCSRKVLSDHCTTASTLLSGAKALYCGETSNVANSACDISGFVQATR